MNFPRVDLAAVCTCSSDCQAFEALDLAIFSFLKHLFGVCYVCMGCTCCGSWGEVIGQLPESPFFFLCVGTELRSSGFPASALVL